jgi:O-antigen/teichoic acid export membrane protein
MLYKFRVWLKVWLSIGSLGRNLVSNYLAVAWMAMLSLALIPVYLRTLSSSQWGIVALCISIQGFLGLLDVGLSQLMPKEIAQRQDDSSHREKLVLVFTHSYLFLGFLGFSFGQFAIPWLLEYWFNNGQGVPPGTETCLRLVLVQFLFQFSNNAHVGYWNGMQMQAKANFRQCTFGTLKHLSALFLLYFWRADAISYLPGLEWFFNKKAIRYKIDYVLEFRENKSQYISMANQSFGLFLSILVGTLLVQCDRIFLSKAMDASVYGYYLVVANFGSAFTQLQSPIMRAIAPIIFSGKKDTSVNVANITYILISFLCVVPVLVASYVAPWLLFKLIGHPHNFIDLVFVFRLMLLAVVVNSLYQIIYTKMIGLGAYKFIFFINSIALTFVVIGFYWVGSSLGVVAGGYSWLVISLVQITSGIIWSYVVK